MIRPSSFIFLLISLALCSFQDVWAAEKLPVGAEIQLNIPAQQDTTRPNSAIDDENPIDANQHDPVWDGDGGGGWGGWGGGGGNSDPTCYLPDPFPTGYEPDEAGCADGGTAATCSVRCAAGYGGTVVVSCASSGDTFSISGCSAIGGVLSWTKLPDGPFETRFMFGLTVHNDKLIITGGQYDSSYYVRTDVWSSPDALAWNLQTSNAEFIPRWAHVSVSYAGYVWVISGAPAGGGEALNDVWRSADDGTSWEADFDATFPNRLQACAVVFKSKIFVIGGYNWGGKNDVWSATESGGSLSWTEETPAAEFAGRGTFVCIVHKDKMWVMGGSAAFRDVFSSDTGAYWELITSSAAMLAHQTSGGVSYDNKMWFIGGQNSATFYSDVYFSEDGATWNLDSSDSFSPRGGMGVAVLGSKIVMIGGRNSRDASGDFNEIYVASVSQGNQAVDCVGHYEDFEQCSQTCGTGQLMQQYVITTEAAHGGQPCPAAAGESQTVPCNTRACPTTCTLPTDITPANGYLVGGCKTPTTKAECSVKCAKGYKGTIKVSCSSKSPTFVITGHCNPLPKCTGFPCPVGNVLKSNPSSITCKASPCKPAECCRATAVCTKFKCPNSYTKRAQPDQITCAKKPCQRAECCEELFCPTFTCPFGTVPRDGFVTIRCKKTKCTKTECCRTTNTCKTFTCTTGTKVANNVTCQQRTCLATECCV